MIFRNWAAAVCGGLLLVLSFHSAHAQPTTEDNTASSPLISHYRQALRIDPDNPTLRYFLGVALLGHDRPQVAIAEFRQAYAAYIDSVEMNYNLGLAYYRVGDPDNATLYIDQAEFLGALEQEGVYPIADIYFNIGLAYLERDNRDEALRSFRKVLAIDPERHAIRRLTADIHARSGRIDEALAEFDRFLQAYPDDASAREYVYALHFNRAQQLIEKEQFDAARRNLHNALAATPDSPLAVYYLGYIDYSQGRYENAAEHLAASLAKTSEEIRQSAAAMLYNSALELLEQRKTRMALEAVSPLLEGSTADPQHLYLGANIHLALKQFDRARRLYRRILDLDPAHRGAAINLAAVEAGAVDELYEKGRALFRSEDYLQALEHLQTVLEINPSESRALAYVEEIEATLQRQAAAAFDQAREKRDAGQLREALARARDGLRLRPGSEEGEKLEGDLLAALEKEVEKSFRVAEELRRQGDLGAAEAAYEKTLALDPDHSQARRSRQEIAEQRRKLALAAAEKGNLALAEGRLEEARGAFDRALQEAPDLAAARDGLTKTEALVSNRVTEALQWGRRAKAGGELEEARKHFEAALQLRASEAVRKELTALERAVTERLDNLLAAAREAMDRGRFQTARGHLKRLLDQASSNSEAEELLARVDRRQAEAAAARLRQAQHQLDAGRLQEALAGFRRVLDLDPGNEAAKSGLQQGQARLRQELEQWVARGETAIRDGRLDAAEQAFDRVLSLDPYRPEALAGRNRLAQLRQSGDNPGSEKALYLQGIELYTRGKYEEAISIWQRVLVLVPDHEKALLNIDKAKRKLRRIKVFRDG